MLLAVVRNVVSSRTFGPGSLPMPASQLLMALRTILVFIME